MKIEDLIKLTGKSRKDVEKMLSDDKEIILDLSERSSKKNNEKEAEIEVIG